MKLLDIINKRYSCRKYAEKALDPTHMDYIMECVRLAPSAVNKQPWKFHILQSDEDKIKIRQCYDRPWFNSAPTYIVATILHDEEWVRADGKRHGNIDIAIAVEHLCLAATEQGLGTCWVCNFDARKCSELLNLPDNEEPAVIIPIGYPDCETTPKKRKSKEDIIIGG